MTVNAPGHSPMTHDAALILARDLDEKNQRLEAELIAGDTTGLAIGLLASPAPFVERRLRALEMMLLDDDQTAELELRYQDLVTRMLEDLAEGIAREANRSVLLAGVSAAAGAAALRDVTRG